MSLRLLNKEEEPGSTDEVEASDVLDLKALVNSHRTPCRIVSPTFSFHLQGMANDSRRRAPPTRTPKPPARGPMLESWGPPWTGSSIRFAKSWRISLRALTRSAC